MHYISVVGVVVDLVRVKKIKFIMLVSNTEQIKITNYIKDSHTA